MNHSDWDRQLESEDTAGNDPKRKNRGRERQQWRRFKNEKEDQRHHHQHIIYVIISSGHSNCN